MLPNTIDILQMVPPSFKLPSSEQGGKGMEAAKEVLTPLYQVIMCMLPIMIRCCGLAE